MPSPDPAAPFAYTKLGRTKPLKSKDTSLLWCVVDLATGSWMRTGDHIAKSLREQLLMEQTNIAVVAALFLTVSVGMLMLADKGNEWEDRWERGVFCLVLNISNLLMTVAVILSVFIMLAVNECKDEPELKRFDRLMGFLVQLPLLLFISGVAIFGSVGCGFWVYLSFEWEWFLGITVPTYAASAITLIPAVLRTLQMLYRAKDDRFGTVIIAGDQVSLALKACIARDESGGECVDMEAFMEYVSMVCQAEQIAPLTQVKMQTALEAWQQVEVKTVLATDTI
uniref:Uncharacterized protein n=1 Tax=Alexandrium monilatum TaxID=311494 RepID=A0A7S4QAN8_9DINO|mmetsp:Transcript_92695/g.276440  ORF Transcript_92695/g.276440 Transcript_92695/m.276440 type:complete len:282 (+) Transcript_92695:93-938(+)